ncbi:hypothetical protein NDU88_003455 [Pleurodeles waltl]|uniref:Uncharacterized protein n=1 Tax=Pleurodeles waltl TaxID=8319 RepID=A0AAV7M3F8_PLEWA|nr:hypothetical protein NDU88_003455 [Pleurodeles waltl]
MTLLEGGQLHKAQKIQKQARESRLEEHSITPIPSPAQVSLGNRKCWKDGLKARSAQNLQGNLKGDRALKLFGGCSKPAHRNFTTRRARRKTRRQPDIAQHTPLGHTIDYSSMSKLGIEKVDEGGCPTRPSVVGPTGIKDIASEIMNTTETNCLDGKDKSLHAKVAQLPTAQKDRKTGLK